MSSTVSRPGGRPGAAPRGRAGGPGRKTKQVCLSLNPELAALMVAVAQELKLSASLTMERVLWQALADVRRPDGSYNTAALASRLLRAELERIEAQEA